jgi:DNA-binding MarR family transcriptional regulator
MHAERPLIDIVTDLHKLNAVTTSTLVLCFLDTRLYRRATYREIREELELGKSSLTMLMNKLESENLVEKCRAVADNRQCHYYLTLVGATRVREIDDAISGRLD